MKVEADKITWNLGDNIYGQPVRLVYERNTAGRSVWVIYRDAANQRDDSVNICGLTEEQILTMAEIVKNNR